MQHYPNIDPSLSFWAKLNKNEHVAQTGLNI